MRIMIASDIHGSSYYCEKMMTLFEKKDCRKLLLLGDILYHGPRNNLPHGYTPKEVIPMLNDKKEIITCVRGNCDAEVDGMVLDFDVSADYNVLDIDGISLFLTHGHIYGEAKPPKVKRGTVVLEGHTHVPKCNESDGIYYLNPGSVTIPKSNSEHSVIIYENRTFSWYNLDGEKYKEFIYK